METNLRVVDVLLGSVRAQAFRCDLELSSGVAERHESKDPDKNADGVGLDALESADIDSLRVITQPVAKVNAFDHHAGPLVTLKTSDLLEHIFDVAMAPVVALNLGDGGDVTCTEGMRRCDQAEDDNEA